MVEKASPRQCGGAGRHAPRFNMSNGQQVCCETRQQYHSHDGVGEMRGTREPGTPSVQLRFNEDTATNNYPLSRIARGQWQWRPLPACAGQGGTGTEGASKVAAKPTGGLRGDPGGDRREEEIEWLSNTGRHLGWIGPAGRRDPPGDIRFTQCGVRARIVPRGLPVIGALISMENPLQI